MPTNQYGSKEFLETSPAHACANFEKCCIPSDCKRDAQGVGICTLRDLNCGDMGAQADPSLNCGNGDQVRGRYLSKGGVFESKS